MNQSPSILIVDDVPDNLNLLGEMLRGRGYRVRPVTSGELALEAAAASPPDLILLDIDMPGMNGFEVCEQLKAKAELREIPVIFISAMTDIADKVKGFAVGGVDYVTKPFQFEEVNARVGAHLELLRQKRELKSSYGQLRALEKLRDDLVHMVVHDLRSPLTAICSLLYCASVEPDVPALVKEDIDASLKAAGKLNSMVSSVLDVSKFEAGAMTLKLGDCNLVTIINTLIEEMRGLVGERRIRFAPNAQGLSLSADPDIVTRILQNLLSNAIKFTPRNGEIRVALDEGADTVRAVVSDDGPGVPREFQQAIFEKFGQIETQAAQGRRSPGLGLTFCKLAVEAHGGQIGVESGGQKSGSSFWFTLPKSGPRQA